jgi:hypothetical protein
MQKLTMILPFDKINEQNFPYYVKTFCPKLFNLVYGEDYEILYFDRSTLNEYLVRNRSQHSDVNGIRIRALLDIIGERKKNTLYPFDTKGIIIYLIKNRHLEDYWVQSHFMKQL